MLAVSYTLSQKIWILHILEYKFVIENPEKGYKCHF